jgi:hypothetical protein
MLDSSAACLLDGITQPEGVNGCCCLRFWSAGSDPLLLRILWARAGLLTGVFIIDYKVEAAALGSIILPVSTTHRRHENPHQGVSEFVLHMLTYHLSATLQVPVRAMQLLLHSLPLC